MTMRSFRDLRVWKAAMDLVEKIYRLTQAFPKQEIYGLTSQMSPSHPWASNFMHCEMHW
jgi:23S rRNA-intervening sequence protein